ncbi:hypothetical protein BH11MYX1_BH11MYX1_56690 [soil metagenome]
MSLEELLATRSAVTVPSNVASSVLAAARARFHYQRYALLDRGSYEHDDAPHAPELVAALTARIAEVAGEARTFISARALRLVPGDYVLAHHDRIHETRVLECVLDLSPAPVAKAEVHYRQHGQVFFRVPCEPGSVAMVPRGPTVSCNFSYVSKLHTGAEVVRWIALFG